ncbi:MAG: hypothetical protein IPM18_17435 [Phycisphaerales bacterium]|nr:hypothetical protein [Phycisphaerales bacterium]
MARRAADHLPNRITELWLRPPRMGRLAVLGVCLFVAVASGVALAQGNPHGRFGLIFFGTAAVLTAMGLHPRAGFLHAGPTGLALGVAFRVRRYAWNDIAMIQVVEVRRSIVSMRRHVVVELRGAALARAREAGEETSVTLPTSLGISAEELALLLHAWQTHFLNVNARG